MDPDPNLHATKAQGKLLTRSSGSLLRITTADCMHVNSLGLTNSCMRICSQMRVVVFSTQQGLSLLSFNCAFTRKPAAHAQVLP